MIDNVNTSQIVDEIKGVSDEELKELIAKWFESTRMDGLRLGAYMISAAVYDAMVKNIKTGSLRDYQRAMKAIREIVSVQLKQPETAQNDLENVMEESANDE